MTMGAGPGMLSRRVRVEWVRMKLWLYTGSYEAWAPRSGTPWALYAQRMCFKVSQLSRSSRNAQAGCHTTELPGMTARVPGTSAIAVMSRWGATGRATAFHPGVDYMLIVLDLHDPVPQDQRDFRAPLSCRATASLGRPCYFPNEYP